MDSDGFVLSHFQNGDYIMLVGVPPVDNLLTIKTVFRSFKLVSGLKVNLVKSNLFGVSVSKSFLDM